MTSLSHRRSVEGHSSDVSDAYEGNECRLDIPLSTQCFPGSLQFWSGQALLTFSSENVSLLLYFNLSLLCHLHSWFFIDLWDLSTNEFKAEAVKKWIANQHPNTFCFNTQTNLSEELSSFRINKLIISLISNFINILKQF